MLPGRRPPPLLNTGGEGLPPRRRTRIVRRPGEPEVLRIGYESHWLRDLYHQTLTMPWRRFLAFAVALYLAANVAFALLYMVDPGGVEKARPGDFGDAFFFSIQTMATIGYGVLYPSDLYANLIVTAETIVALVVLALLTGLLFSRFSRPTARVLFSKRAVVTTHDGLPTLQIRLSNARRNQILEATVRVTLLRNEQSAEGRFMRRFHDLPLARARTPVFSLSFMVMHPIDAASPLRGQTAAGLEEADAELLVTVTGIDETMSQTIYARWSYTPDEILFGARFADMFGYTDDGRLAIDMRRFDETVPDLPPGQGDPIGDEAGEQDADGMDPGAVAADGLPSRAPA